MSVDTDIQARWVNPREAEQPDIPVRIVEMSLEVQTLLDGPALLDKIHRVLTGGDVRRNVDGEQADIKVSRFPRDFRSLTVEGIYDEGDDE